MSWVKLPPELVSRDGVRLFQSRIYRALCASVLALQAYVVLRAPLWNSVMAGARVQLGSESLYLAAPSWQCSPSPHVCTTSVGGKQLVAHVASHDERHDVCTATFAGEAVACTGRMDYAPRLKAFLTFDQLPGVSFGEALAERPWRVLDLGLPGTLQVLSGFFCAVLLASVAGAVVRRGGCLWLRRTAAALGTLVLASVVWIALCAVLGYID